MSNKDEHTLYLKSSKGLNTPERSDKNWKKPLGVVKEEKLR